MFKNYLTTTVNNLLNNKLYSAINIVGLAVGLAACVLIAMYVRTELSFDKHWSDSSDIYRLNMTVSQAGQPQVKMAQVMGPILPFLRTEFELQIDRGTRVVPIATAVSIGEEKYDQPVMWVDAEFGKIFQFPILEGSLETTFASTGNIALSEKEAKRYFGEKSALGKVITITRKNRPEDNQVVNIPAKNYRVSAVYHVPKNTVMQIPALALIDETEFQQQPDYFENMSSTRALTYIKLKKQVNVAEFELKLKEYVNSLFPEVLGSSTFRADWSLQNIADIQLNPADNSEINATGSILTVVLFSAISVLVLLVACFNFIILTTAKGKNRGKEVAMRKTIGAKRKQLLIQFLGESVFLVLIALLISLVLVELLTPSFTSLVSRELSISYQDPLTLGFLLLILGFVAVVGGAYPAFILSGLKPGHILQSNQARGSIKTGFRNGLVFLQFVVSIALMVATGIVYCQIYYSINRSPGFDKDNLLVVEDLTRPEVSPQRKALTQQLHSLANVSDVTLSSERPMRSGGNQLPVTVPAGNSKVGSTSEQPILVTYMVVGYNFFETYRMKLLTGRFYNESFPGDVLPRAGENYSGEILQGSVIINEKAAQTLGFSSPNDAEGRLVRSYVGGSATGPVSADLKIVGVIGDAQFRNMQATAAPTMYYLSPQSNSLSVATIRYRGEESEILKLVANVWGTVVGDHILASAFVDSEISTQFVQENRELKMLTGFSLLAICIACLGLFGVASYVVERRTKEVGLRKVMGAKIRQIVRLVTWEFSKPILWANLMAWPIAVIVMTYWLEQFASRVDIFIFVPLCLGAGVLSMVVACLTVFGSVNRVAKMKPADSLRYE